MRARELEDGRFEVERIVDKREKQKSSRLGGVQVEYLVKWRHYPDTDNTWESRETLLDGAADTVAEFEKAEAVRTRIDRLRRRAERRLEAEAGR